MKRLNVCLPCVVGNIITEISYSLEVSITRSAMNAFGVQALFIKNAKPYQNFMLSNALKCCEHFVTQVQ
jgi:hypothetical protein